MNPKDLIESEQIVEEIVDNLSESIKSWLKQIEGAIKNRGWKYSVSGKKATFTKGKLKFTAEEKGRIVLVKYSNGDFEEVSSHDTMLDILDEIL